MKTLQELTRESHTRAENMPFTKHLMSGKITKHQYLSYLLAYYPVYVVLEKKMLDLHQNGLIPNSSEYKHVIAELFMLNPASNRIKQDIYELVRLIAFDQATAFFDTTETFRYKNTSATTPSRTYSSVVDDSRGVDVDVSAYADYGFESFDKVFSDTCRTLFESIGKRLLEDHVIDVCNFVDDITNLDPVSNAPDRLSVFANVYVRFAADLAGGQIIRKLVPGSGRLYTVSDPTAARQFLRSLVTPPDITEDALETSSDEVNGAFAANICILEGLQTINPDIA